MDMKRVKEIEKGIDELDFSEDDVYFLVNTIKQQQEQLNNYKETLEIIIDISGQSQVDDLARQALNQDPNEPEYDEYARRYELDGEFNG